jgi:hypothetical protein
MYKTVCELTQEELNELKARYFFQDDIDNEILGDIAYPEDIPNDFIINYYSDTLFTDDDFFCNILY